MDKSFPKSDAERELDALRKRAYGPHHDIEDDPAALARLTELETTRIKKLPESADTGFDQPATDAEGTPVVNLALTISGADQPSLEAAITPEALPKNSSPRSLRHRIAATHARRGWFVAAALVALLGLVYTVEWLRPHPDATLHQIAEEGDLPVFSMLEFLGADVDRSSIRDYEPYRGLEPWFAVDRQGRQCLMVINRLGPSVDGANCVPPEADLFADIGAWPLLGDRILEDLPDGSLIRFHYRGDSVHVVLYPATEDD